MLAQHRPSVCSLALSVLVLGLLIVRSEAQDSPANPKAEDGWVSQRDVQSGILVETRVMTLHPRPESKPALKHRLLLDEFERTPGNAAIYYLKAAGFLNQDPSRDWISKFKKDAAARAKKEGKDINQLPPYVWLSTPPNLLPLNDVKNYLRVTSFQPPMLREGARRSHFDMERNFREVDDPIGYLLPEIQDMRELARNQSIRCRLAIAEGRIDDAIEITGQQFALAQHLGQDDFLISSLVGMAVASIAWNDALYLVQHPKAPNLYWALATMPSPLVDTRRAMAVERQTLYQQLKVLREVDEKPRPVGYYQDFIDRLLPQMGYLSSEFKLPSVDDNPQAARAALVGFVAAAYPRAKQYLIKEQKLPRDQVEAYPTAQVVFLAIVRFYDHWRDEVFKWTSLPIWQSRSKTSFNDVYKNLRVSAERYGWCTWPTQMMLSNIFAIRTAAGRCDQKIALLQAVEAIRMYAATHDGKLPPSLDALSVATPIEPFTGKPISYELIGKRAVLSGHVLPGIRYRLVVRIAE